MTRRQDERIRRAAELLREKLPELPAEVDRRVLTMVMEERRARERARPAVRRALAAAVGERRAHAGAPPASAPPRAGWRRLGLFAALLRPRTALLGVAALLAVAIWGPSLGPLTRTDTAAAVAIGPLRAACPPLDRDAIEVAGVWSGREARSFARVLGRFERETGVEVRYAYETRDIAPKLRARVAQGCPPDVALLPQPGLMVELARAGALQPIGTLAGDLVRRGYGAAWRRLGSVDGRLYGVWFKASNKSMLWYRPAALRAAGVDGPPATWDALVRDGRRLAAAGIRPLSIAGADGWTLTDWFENVYLRDAGPRRYDQLARGEIPWTHRSVRRALARLGRLVGDEALVGAPSEVLRTTFEASVRAALDADATAAMVAEGDFVRSFVRAGAPRFADFPAIGRGDRDALIVGGDVAVLCSRAAAARRLLRYLATPAAAEPWAHDGGFVSPNARVPASAYPDAMTQRTAARLSRARTVRFDLSDLQPPAFGATAGRGMWRLFQELAVRPDATRELARRLELAARAARRGG